MIIEQKGVMLRVEKSDKRDRMHRFLFFFC